MKPARKCTWVFTPHQGPNDQYDTLNRLAEGLNDELSRICYFKQSWRGGIWFWKDITKRNLRNAWKELTRWK